jgi:hypothetical protein
MAADSPAEDGDGYYAMKAAAMDCGLSRTKRDSVELILLEVRYV